MLIEQHFPGTTTSTYNRVVQTNLPRLIGGLYEIIIVFIFCHPCSYLQQTN